MRAKSVDLKTWSSNLLDLGGTSKLKFHTALRMLRRFSSTQRKKYSWFLDNEGEVFNNGDVNRIFI